MKTTTALFAFAALVVSGTAAVRGLYAQPSPAPSVVGDAARGAPLYADTYNCYACHGFDAQSGERRLVPMNYTQDGFITFVQNSPLPQMPRFPDASAQDLADIWAYIRTLPADAAAIDDLPALREIRERQRAALGR
jgi:mono/diheme cytochrome c family protein